MLFEIRDVVYRHASSPSDSFATSDGSFIDGNNRGIHQAMFVNLCCKQLCRRQRDQRNRDKFPGTFAMHIDCYDQRKPRGRKQRANPGSGEALSGFDLVLSCIGEVWKDRANLGRATLFQCVRQQQ